MSVAERSTIEVTPKKILIVEDDESLSENLKDHLASKGYNVSVAGNGKIAQDMIPSGHFDLVILDIRLPVMSGVELLRYIRQTHSIPVILMTGMISPSQTKDAFLLGASGFLSKPFKIVQLTDLVKSLIPLNMLTNRPELLDDEYYRKISIDDFKNGGPTKYDTYLRLAPNKFIKILDHGKEIPVDKIMFLKTKNIHFLHLTKDDFQKYIYSKIFHTKILPEPWSLAPEEKTILFKDVHKILTERMFINEFDADLYEAAKSVVDSTVDILSSNKELFDLVLRMQKHSRWLFEHSVCVSFLSSMVALRLKWESSQTIYKISVAGFFHDIGFLEMDSEIVGKSTLELTADQTLLMQTHSTKSVEILSKISFMPEDLIQIINQHHENCLGTGYPVKLTKSRIHPIARLVAVCDSYSELSMREENQLQMSAQDAVQQLFKFCSDTLDYTFLLCLASLVGLEQKNIGKK